MRAIVKRYYISEEEDLSLYEPDEPQIFGFTLTFAIGQEDDKGEDFFEVLVASGAYLAQYYSKQTPRFLRHIMLMSDYDVLGAVALMNKYVSSLEEDSWQKLADKIGRIARWEYEDYRP